MKTIITITVRLKSTRLPRKALLRIKNKSILQYIIDSAKELKGHDIVLCTSNLKEDDEIELVANRNGVYCYRGHPDDVLLRLYNAAKFHNADYIISTTGDNPFTSFCIGSWLLMWAKDKKLDFVYTDKYPLGVAPYILKTSAMEQAVCMKTTQNTEIWGTLFLDSGFEADNAKFIHELHHPEWRLTVDYPEDFMVAERIIKNVYKEEIPPLCDIFTYLDNNKDVLELNNHLIQKNDWRKNCRY